MFSFDMKCYSSTLPEMCQSLQFYKTSEKFSGWPVTVFFFNFFGLASNLENPVLKLPSYLVIPHTDLYLDLCMQVVVLRLMFITARIHSGCYCCL